MSYGGSAHVSCQWGSAGSRWLLTEEGVWKALSEQQMERHICLQVPSACQQSRDKLWEDSGLNQVGDGWMDRAEEWSTMHTEILFVPGKPSSWRIPIQHINFAVSAEVVVLLWSSHASGKETHLDFFFFGGKTPYRDFFGPQGADFPPSGKWWMKEVCEATVHLCDSTPHRWENKITHCPKQS